MNPEEGREVKWILDSGAVYHVTNDPNLLHGLQRGTKEQSVTVVAYGTTLPILGHGSVQTNRLKLPDVLCVPGIQYNLVSVSMLIDRGYRVEFGPAYFCVKDGNGNIVGKGQLYCGHYVIDYLFIDEARNRPQDGHRGRYLGSFGWIARFVFWLYLSIKQLITSHWGRPHKNAILPTESLTEDEEDDLDKSSKTQTDLVGLSQFDRRNSRRSSYTKWWGQIAGKTRLHVGDLRITEDGEDHGSREKRDRFGLSRFGSNSNGGQTLIELRSAHAYPSLASAPNGRGNFVMDSGASYHVTPHEDLLQAYMERDHPMFPDIFRQLELVCADGNRLAVHGMGNIDIRGQDGTDIIRLEDVLHVPGLATNLVSVSFLTHQIDDQLVARGAHQHEAVVAFTKNYFTVRIQYNGVPVRDLGGGTGARGDVYYLDTLQQHF